MTMPPPAGAGSGPADGRVQGPIRYAHRSHPPDAVAVGPDTVELRLRTGRGQARAVAVRSGDRYGADWSRVAALQPMGSDDEWDYWEGRVQEPSRRLRYRFEALDQEGRTEWLGEDGSASPGGEAEPFHLPYLAERDCHQVPAWVGQAVAYEIFCDRFARTRPGWRPAGADPWDVEPGPGTRLGGSLEGIRRKLGYLEALGVNLLYLTPVFRAPSSHRYDTSDYFEVDPGCGSKEDLKALVEDAHRRGMRVLLDGVFNHCGAGFAPFADVRRRGRASPYWDWFVIYGDRVFMDPPNYETFARGIASMPKLRTANPAVEAYLLEVAVYWLREAGIDGWRLDVADEVDHVFWRRFRDRVKVVNPDALIIGEVWHDALPWLYGDQFDGVMHYRWREAAVRFWLMGRGTARDFQGSMVRLHAGYPGPAACASFLLLGSHDTARALTVADGNQAALARALVFQFTWPGIPLIYYGDEAGMTGGPDPGCRQGMWWDARRRRPGLYPLVRELAHLRRSRPALASGRVRMRAVQGAVVYDRLPDGPHPLLRVAVNPAPDAVVVDLPPGARRLLAFGGAPRGRVAAGGAAVWELPVAGPNEGGEPDGR